jgi:hypothetical protein
VETELKKGRLCFLHSFTQDSYGPSTLEGIFKERCEGHKGAKPAYIWGKSILSEGIGSAEVPNRHIPGRMEVQQSLNCGWWTLQGMSSRG